MPDNAWQKFEKLYFRFFPLVLRRVSAEIWKDQLLPNDDGTEWNEALAVSLCAFHRVLSGRNHPQYDNAQAFLRQTNGEPLTRELRDFLHQGIREIRDEIQQAASHDAGFSARLEATYRWLEQAPADIELDGEVIERFWNVFFPEGMGILGREKEAEEALRQKRRVKILEKHAIPVRKPAAEILFTSNVLLTVPLKAWDIDRLPVSDSIKKVLKEHANDPQEFWYDHPIPVGIPAEQNEVLYGLRGLNEMMAFEKARGTADKDQRLTVVLSCSVTHSFLHQIAREYLQRTIRQAGGFEHLDVYLFTEQDMRDWLRLFFNEPEKRGQEAIGVDGPYGRHYSFLKAIAAWWQVFVNPALKATFKIDLDQVFDEERLVAETGQSALEHFQTALWGSDGIDAEGNPLRLGMIAGALVNAEDIAQSLFTPDVPYPSGPQHADEFVFFSRLPQALSTVAEMMTKYNTPQLDGEGACLQRIHVTGGTNGILIDALRRFKPFTPSFIGRAEDQAYLLSTMRRKGLQLGYVHKPGLIMRHDKTLFASEAIKAAEIGKMIGDYERILLFSAYARVLGEGDYYQIKRRVDPFTGCFISSIPVTVVYLRFVFKLWELLQFDRHDEAQEMVRVGVPRLRRALEFVRGENSALRRQFERERKAWDAFYHRLQMHEEKKDMLSGQAAEFLKAIRLV